MPAEDDGGHVHYFNMEDCVLAAVENEHISCPQHVEKPVLLQELVPELFMTDFPARYLLPIKGTIFFSKTVCEICLGKLIFVTGLYLIHCVCVCVCVCVRLFLQRAQLEYSEEEPHILGQGGSGTVIYQARYCSQPVAIKRFHFKKCHQQTDGSNTGKETSFSCKL